MKTVLITGCNRGIGLEFVEQYAAAGWQVLATCRDPASAPELEALAHQYSAVEVQRLDVSDQANVQKLAEDLSNDDLDQLIHNAGFYPPQGGQLDTADPGPWLNAFAINTIAPLMITRALLPNLLAGADKKVAILSSKVGSIEDNHSGGSYAYRSSKTAVNQVMKSLSIDLAGQDIKVVSLHPGWVKTAMGGPNALITVEQSVRGMRQVLADLGPAQSGQFFNYDGAPIPW